MSCLIPVDIFYKHVDSFLPVGYRFHPTDEELVNYYLRRQILGYKDDPCIIPETPSVHKFDPWHLPGLFRERSIVRSQEAEWWFLSRLLFKTRNSSKYDRQTPSGHWKTTGQEKKINAKGTNKLIGTMRNLVFIENEGSSATETVWVMHEYHLHDCNFGANFLDQQRFVLCHLINKRDEFIDASTSVEAASMSSFLNLDNDKARSNIPENVMEAVMDPRAETLCPPVNPNLSSTQPIVDMGTPSDIHITNDNQFDWLELVDRTEKDGSINKFLDETDHGQGWWLPTDRAIERGEHMPREETSVPAQDNLQQEYIYFLNVQVVEDYPEINCLTRDPTPTTQASRRRDTVQLPKKLSGGLTRGPVTLQASRGRDRVPLQNKPPGRLASKEREVEKDKAAANISKNVFSMRELKARLEQTQEIEQSRKSESSDFTASSAESPTMVRDKGLQGSVSREISNRNKNLESKSFQTSAKQNRKVRPSSKSR
ncbi:NAC domain-containing protein 16-like isoform X2 [Syzygium oleosum]|uniref:NAC domain-containing protein 16-like isoform X2 n=1 Tax=Syzygium oleosum TaxID=219896 RepID=UPI0011D1BD85|nr:NAC domain-containing protein 16-like isoform X2 [Syzygium oleosum]